VLAVDHQDGIRTVGHESHGHPADQQAKLRLGQVHVRAQQLDRAVGAGLGERQLPFRTPKVHGGSIDHRPSLRAELDGLTAGIPQVEVTVRGAGRAIATYPHVHCRLGAIEPRPGLEHRENATGGTRGWKLAAVAVEAVDQPVAEACRLEPIDLQPVAHRHLHVNAAVGRAKGTRIRCEAQQRLDRVPAIPDITVGRSLGRSRWHHHVSRSGSRCWL